MNEESRQEWARTFNISWFGVYNCTRASMPLLVVSEDALMIITSSLNGFWALERSRNGRRNQYYDRHGKNSE